MQNLLNDNLTLQYQSSRTIASSKADKSETFRHKMSYLNRTEVSVTEYPIEEHPKEWITERLCAAMIEALFKQNMITESQRREICHILKCDILNGFERK